MTCPSFTLPDSQPKPLYKWSHSGRGALDIGCVGCFSVLVWKFSRQWTDEDNEEGKDDDDEDEDDEDDDDENDDDDDDDDDGECGSILLQQCGSKAPFVPSCDRLRETEYSYVSPTSPASPASPASPSLWGCAADTRYTTLHLGQTVSTLNTQHSALYWTALQYTTHYRTAMNCTTLHCTTSNALDWTVMQGVTLCCTGLQHNALNCTAMQFTNLS